MISPFMTAYHEKWEIGKGIELKFWNNWIQTRGADWPDDFQKRMSPDNKADSVVTGLIDKSCKIPKVLDLGAGPISVFPLNLHDGRKVELTAVDALADNYAATLRTNKIKPLVETIQGMGERLGKVADSNYFDFVYMRNALDHTYSPFDVIESMLNVLKAGCVAFLTHKKNLGARENYEGSAMWNITGERNNFIIWNENRRINISKELEKFTRISIIDTENWIDVSMVKKSNF
jgi:2-polyprenyl-3-methyl-5-hydroxy-6-metoxy-1,4-benzoquinol methylase